MDSEDEVGEHALELQKIDEVFEDRDSDIFYTLLSFGPIHQLKTKLEAFKDQGIDLHGIFQSYFYHFCLEQTLNFPYFIDWYASNYSSYERIIMDCAKTKILCPINSPIIWDSLVSLPKFT